MLMRTVIYGLVVLLIGMLFTYQYAREDSAEILYQLEGGE